MAYASMQPCLLVNKDYQNIRIIDNCNFSIVLMGTSVREGANFFHFFRGGGIGQHSVGLMYSKHVALQCRYSVLVAEWLNSSAANSTRKGRVHSLREGWLCSSSQTTIGSTRVIGRTA